MQRNDGDGDGDGDDGHTRRFERALLPRLDSAMAAMLSGPRTWPSGDLRWCVSSAVSTRSAIAFGHCLHTRWT